MAGSSCLWYLPKAFNILEPENSYIFITNYIFIKCRSLSESHITITVVCVQFLRLFGINNSLNGHQDIFSWTVETITAFLVVYPVFQGACLPLCLLRTLSCCSKDSAGGPELLSREKPGWGVNSLIYRSRLRGEGWLCPERWTLWHKNPCSK